MITLAVERFDRAYDDSLPLQRLHWDEICTRKDVMRIDPDLETYRAAEQLERLVVVTAREAGTLVGYVIYFVNRHPHYRRLMLAIEDLKFLHPAYRRRPTVAMRLIEAGERAAIDLARRRVPGGKVLLTTCCKTGHDHSSIHLRRGYALQDTILAKVVD